MLSTQNGQKCSKFHRIYLLSVRYSLVKTQSCRIPVADVNTLSDYAITQNFSKCGCIHPRIRKMVSLLYTSPVSVYVAWCYRVGFEYHWQEISTINPHLKKGWIMHFSGNMCRAGNPNAPNIWHCTWVKSSNVVKLTDYKSISYSQRYTSGCFCIFLT